MYLNDESVDALIGISDDPIHFINSIMFSL